MALCIPHDRKLEDICRLCLKLDGIMLPIFDRTNGENNCNFFAEQISSIAHVEINVNDGLPSTICAMCKKLVEQFYEFRVQVEVSDKTLRSYLKVPQFNAQTVENSFETNNETKDMIYALLMPSDEHIQIWDVSNVLQSPEHLNKIIKSEYINNQENLENIEEVTAIESEISCQLCSISFTSISDLKNHVMEHCSITKKQIFSDKSIHNSFLSDENAIDNQTVEIFNQQDIKEYSNKIDDEINNDNNFINKNNESKKQINETKLKCKYCDKLYSNVTSVIHNEQCRFREKRLVCNECGKHFTKRSELRYHKGTHLTTPLTCEYCNKQFRNVQSLSIHVKRHTHGTRYHCETCGKSYYTNSELARHVQMHLDKRKHPCHLCDMSFMSQPELNRHLQYHNGLKRFECNICTKSYYESGHLKVHQRIHTGERPFVCELCNKGFVTRSKLVRHAKIHNK